MQKVEAAAKTGILDAVTLIILSTKQWAIVIIKNIYVEICFFWI